MNHDIRIKALVLAGGRGQRLLEHTQEINKAILQVRGRYLIERSFDNAAAIGVSEIVVVVGYMAEKVIQAIGDSFRGIPITYVLQKEQKGVVDAMECSRPAIGESDFVLMLSDEYFLRPRHASFLRFFRDRDAFAVCGIVYAQDRNRIRKTYSVACNPQTKEVSRLVEKPTVLVNNIMGTGNVLFKNQILGYLDATPVNSQRHEKELPGLIQCAIDDGQTVLYYPIARKYVNVNTPEDVLDLERVWGSV